jgi:hypothetical protein
MTDQSTSHEYLVVSRGQWDKTLSKQQIQTAIEQFYAWYDGNVEAGRMRTGHRLTPEGRVVSRRGVTDGPFVETKEVIGGIWFIVADSLEEATALAAENPCIACGLSFEIRPIEPKRASAYVPSNETPTG